MPELRFPEFKSKKPKQESYQMWIEAMRGALAELGFDPQDIADRRQIKQTFEAFQSNPDMTEEDASEIGPKAHLLLSILRGERGPSPASPGAAREVPSQDEEEPPMRMAA